MLVLLGLYFLIPESTRWLLAKGRISEAKRGLLQRAKINKCAPIPEELLEGTVTEAKDTQQVYMNYYFSLITIEQMKMCSERSSGNR